MSDKNTELKKEIVYYAKLLDEKGLVNTLEGNLSILDRETEKIYIIGPCLFMLCMGHFLSG